MDALAFLQTQAANADRMLRQVFEPVTPEQAAWRLPDSRANTIGATFMHAYFSEDQMIHAQLGTPTVFETGKWRDRIGYDHSTVWTYTGAHQPGLLREYADAVVAASQQYLSGLDPAAMDQEIETQRGLQPRAGRLAVYLLNHKFQHAGEIGALLGCQGLQGLP